MPKKIITTDTSHIHSHIAWLALGITFVCCLFFVLATFVPVTKSSLDDNIAGWGWSAMLARDGTNRSGFGLTSFNDCYCNDPDPLVCPALCYGWLGGGDYGLNVDFDSREIQGWAWSGGVGWICFGDSCCSAGGGQDYCTDGPPDGSAVTVTYDDSQNPSPISGWAKIISLGDKGWMSLRGAADDGSEYGLRFSTTTLEIEGLAWNGFSDPGGIPATGNMMPYHGYGWLCINEYTNWTGAEQPLCPETSVFVNIPYMQTVDGNIYSRTDILPELAPPSGYYNATYLILAGGNISHVTSSELYKNPSFTDSYLKPAYPTDIWLPASSTNFFSPLGYLDIPRIVKPIDNNYGIYEQHAATILSGAYTNPNHRVIINGDLTLGEDVMPGEFTYNLVAGWQTIGIVTEEMDGQLIKDVFPNATGTVYVIVKSLPYPATNFEKGKGYWINNSINESVTVNGTPINNVYYRFIGAGLHTLGAPFTMNLQGIPCISRVQRYVPGSGYVDDWNVNKGEGAWITTNSSFCQFSKNRTDVSVEFSGGATTFVVYGDLNINRNVTYDNTAISDFKDLPSVAYIVFGDVNISPEVTEVAGNFIVLGADGVNCPQIGCGTISTGSGNKYPLTVNGIMMAKQFNMQRAYASALREPSEKIIYDGRLLVNPPPGLADFAKGLPVWSETPPN